MAVEVVPAVQPKTKLIEVKNVSQEFNLPNGKSLKVLEKINLCVNNREVVALLGPSGCGKSTLLRLLAGLIQPSQGEVFYHDKPLRDLNTGVSIVFQSFALFPWMTVAENIQTALQSRGFPASEIEERAQKAIQMVGLAGFEETYPRELSGGMKQRVGHGPRPLGGSRDPLHGRALQPRGRPHRGIPPRGSHRHLGRPGQKSLFYSFGEPRYSRSGLYGGPDRGVREPIPATS